MSEVYLQQYLPKGRQVGHMTWHDGRDDGGGGVDGNLDVAGQGASGAGRGVNRGIPSGQAPSGAAMISAAADVSARNANRWYNGTGENIGAAPGDALANRGWEAGETGRRQTPERAPEEVWGRTVQQPLWSRS